MEWRQFIKQEANDFNATHLYLARIALEIRRSCSSKPNQYKLEDFIMQFKSEETSVATEPADVKTRIAASKAAWKAACGIN